MQDFSNEMTHLDYMDYWMNSIHAHAAINTRNSVDNDTLSPPIFIVGTHRHTLHPDPTKQKEMVRDNPKLYVILKSGYSLLAS